jgi:hypothetical protein
MFSGPFGPSPLELKVFDMMKRLVVGVFVSAVAVVGIAPAASAASSHDARTRSVVATLKKPKPPKVIDWDAPSPVSGGGFTTQRIDWD